MARRPGHLRKQLRRVARERRVRARFASNGSAFLLHEYLNGLCPRTHVAPAIMVSFVGFTIEARPAKSPSVASSY